jgi:hypothetical protein
LANFEFYVIIHSKIYFLGRKILVKGQCIAKHYKNVISTLMFVVLREKG